MERHELLYLKHGAAKPDVQERAAYEIERLTKKVVNYDPDSAGVAATERSLVAQLLFFHEPS